MDGEETDRVLRQCPRAGWPARCLTLVRGGRCRDRYPRASLLGMRGSGPCRRRCLGLTSGRQRGLQYCRIGLRGRRGLLLFLFSSIPYHRRRQQYRSPRHHRVTPTSKEISTHRFLLLA